jgi:hypothetical protein
METHAIEEVVRQRGVVPAAVADVVTRVREHFGDTQPTPQAVNDYIATIPTWEKLGLSEEQFYAYPPEWRLAQGWTYQPPAQRQRPQPVPLTLEQAKTLADLSPIARLTRYRELQAQQGRR